MSRPENKPLSRRLGQKRITSPRSSAMPLDNASLASVSRRAAESLLHSDGDFLITLSRIDSLVLSLLLQADENDAVGQDHLKSIRLVKKHFRALWDLTAECHRVLKELHENSSADVSDLYIIKDQRDFIHAYTQYFQSVTNHLVTKGFDKISKATSAYWKSNKNNLKVLIGETSEVSVSVFLQRLFTEPLRDHVQTYSLLLSKLNGEFFQEGSALGADSLNAFVDLQTFISQALDEASQTKLLWASLSSKITAALCTAERRLQEDSRLVPISVSPGKHDRVLLFDDILVILQGNEIFRCDLKTVWVDSSTRQKSHQTSLSLRVVTPEEEFLLSAKEPQHQTLWFWKLNQLIRQNLTGRRDFPPWGKTGDANGPPTSRFCTYTYKNDGRFKNAVYEGEMSWGKPHGKGTLKWPDGSNHVGDFEFGQENGFGICLVPSALQDRYDCYKCHWVNGVMQGYGICDYADESTYKGYFKDNMRHGFGVLENLNSATNPFKYTGNWWRDKKSGYGVWENTDKGERYIGMWQDNLKHGPGIVLTDSGKCFQGSFILNKLVGAGVLLSEDGSVYEGEFTEECLLAGKGKLTFNNGFTLVGTFNINPNSGLLTQGVLNTSSEDQNESVERKFQLGVGLFPVEERWPGVFEHFQKFLEMGCKRDTEESFLGFHVKLSKKLQKSQEYLYCQRDNEDVSGQIEDIMKEISLLSEQESVRIYLEKALKSPLHPFRKLAKTLSVVFQATYSGIGANLHLLDMAQEEIKHYATKVWEFYRALMVMAAEKNNKIPPALGNEEEISDDLNPTTTVLPLLLPQFHPDLFMLYMLYHQQEDAYYWQGIIRLGILTDTKLLEFLDVQKQLWPLKEIKLTANQRYSIVRHKCFHSAIESLQKIITTVDPKEKLEIILKTYTEIETTVSRVVDKDYKLPMDDLLPLLIYVASRAGIQRLGAEIHFIRDFMDPSNRGGIYDFLLTALESCYEHIQKEEIRHCKY
ncbi:ALS2 C-terminal-like protein [Spea bombifrons]|uniref:ALS2 C-terminal-like protein n=1 Tax=Spea bombifrons TaxID=233779 RepID=UPI00234B3DDA|nr:ALS2 C-terminal-like protein [Spea bombifrons]